MRNIHTGIQQALEAIRIETEKADWQLRLEILQLMLSTSESVVAGARKQAAPQVKQVKQTVPIPRTKWVTCYVDMPKADSGKQKRANMDDDTRFRQQQSHKLRCQINKHEWQVWNNPLKLYRLANLVY